MTMAPDRASARRCVLVGVAFLLAGAAAGCGEPLYPVQGRVLLRGVPLKDKEGAVVLKPDAGKGNRSSTPSVGVLQRDGSFQVQPGALAGWYKVILLATEPGANPNEDMRRVVHARYEK